MHPLSTHACLANVSSLKITTTPVLKMNIFFSTDLASISDETDIKNSKVGLRCKINKAFMDFLHNGWFFKVSCGALEYMETFKIWQKMKKSPFHTSEGTRKPTFRYWFSPLLFYSIMLYMYGPKRSFFILFWHFGRFFHQSFLLYNFPSSVCWNLWFFFGMKHTQRDSSSRGDVRN